MSEQSRGDERRHFTRIAIDTIANIRCGAGQMQTRLLDVSLKGALLERPDGYSGQSGDQCELELILGEATVSMQGSIVHSEADHIGFRCAHIDLESISHLKRLVELNLGDEAALERELHELVM
jgi:hypothetical protein